MQAIVNPKTTQRKATMEVAKRIYNKQGVSKIFVQNPTTDAEEFLPRESEVSEKSMISSRK